MEVLKCVLAVIALLGLVRGIKLFSECCVRRFGHHLFTLRTFWLSTLSINLIWLGLFCFARAAQYHYPINLAPVLVVLGIVPVVWIAYENIHETDLAHGLGGTALQLAVFFPVALYSLPLLVVAIAILLFASFKAGPTWLVER